MADAEEDLRKLEKPTVSKSAARRLALEEFGIDAASVEELNSYDDKNFLIVPCGNCEQKFTLKFHNGVDSRNTQLLNAQSKMMRHLHSKGIICPIPVLTSQGNEFGWFHQKNPDSERIHAVRMLTYIPGTLLDNHRDISWLEKAGELVGEIDGALLDFTDAALDREFLWDLKNTAMLEGFLSAVRQTARHALALHVLQNFRQKVLPRCGGLQKSVIHNDLNDQNILITNDQDRQLAVIDFGDIIHSWRVNDIAICMCYLMMNHDAPLEALEAVFRGYSRHLILDDLELEMLPLLLRSRLACTCIMSAYSHEKDPSNEYLLLTAEPGWQALEFMSNVDDAEFTKMLKKVQSLALATR